MSKLILFPSSTIVNENSEVYPGIRKLLLELKDNGDYVVLISHNYTKINQIKSDLGEDFAFVITTTRKAVREIVDSTNSSHVVLVGSSDVDLHLTSSKKILLLNPLWSAIQEEKAVKYGFGVSTPAKLNQIIRILNNQNVWFYELAVGEKTKVYSLTNANTRGVQSSEIELIEGFNRLLKHGQNKYFEVLLLHFLASIINNTEFQEVDIWGIMPSSSTSLNANMVEIKEKARILMAKRLKEPVFIRHTSTTKSHYMEHAERLHCDRHFDSIIINPYYKKRIRGKTVCILDDYLTNGTSFEALRNMLLHEGVKKILFVSLGRFRRKAGIEYLQQDYELGENPYVPNFQYKLIGTQKLNGNYNDEANDDIKKLYRIITS